MVWEFSRGGVHSAFASYRYIGGLLVRGAGICAAVVVRNQALEEFANGMERRGFRFGARGLCWRRLSSRRLRVCSLSCRGLRRRGRCWRFRRGCLRRRGGLDDVRLHRRGCGLSWGSGFRWSWCRRVLGFRALALFVLAIAAFGACGAAYAVARSGNPQQVAGRQGHG